MSSPKGKKRTSILKKRQSSFGNESPEATTTINTAKKGIAFSTKKTVKEFVHCEDNRETIWGNSYESSITKSDGSQDGSKKLLDLSMSMQTSTSIDITEIGKENVPVTIIEKIQQKTIVQVYEDPVPSSSHQNSLDSQTNSQQNSIETSTFGNLSIAIAADERKRLKQKSANDNLNFTIDIEKEMKIDEDISIFGKNDATVNLTMMMNEEEKDHLKKSRQTIVSNENMDISIEEKKEKVFKKPILAVPDPLSLIPKHLIKTRKNQIFTPSKTPVKKSHQQEISEFMDYFISDTPTKDLCRQMCTAKKHGITPLHCQPESKFSKDSSTSKYDNLRKSSDILRDIGLDLNSPVSKLKKTSFDLDETNRRTIYDTNISVDQMKSLNEARKTLFDGEMEESMEKPAEEFFKLDQNEDYLTKTGSTSMQIVKLQDLPESEKSLRKSEGEMSFTSCQLHPCSTMINASNMDETGISESTNEIARKVSRILKDPNHLTGISSNLSSRFLNYDDSNLNETTNKPRETIFNTEIEVDTDEKDDKNCQSIDIEVDQEKMKSKRATMHVNDDMNLDDSSDFKKPQPVQKPRETIYTHDDIEVEKEDEVKDQVQQKNRQTIYTNEIDIIETSNQSKSPTITLTKNHKGVVPKVRQTIYDDDIEVEDEKVPEITKKSEDMEIENFKKIPKIVSKKSTKNRQTILNNEDMLIENDKVEPINKMKSRETILSTEEMAIDTEESKLHEESIELDKPLSKSQIRILSSKSLDISGVSYAENIQENLQNRKTLYTTEDMNIESNTEIIEKPKETQNVEKQRQTIYQENEMSIDSSNSEAQIMIVDPADIEIHNEPKKHRHTTFADEIEVESEENTPKIQKLSSSKISTNEIDIETEMIMTENHTELHEKSEFNLKIDNFEASGMDHSLLRKSINPIKNISIHQTIENVNSIYESDASLTGVILPPPQLFIDSLSKQEEEEIFKPEISLPPAFLSTNAIHEDEVSSNEEEEEDDEKLESYEEVKFIGKSFVNLTDAEFNSFIDDESDPCMSNNSVSNVENEENPNNTTLYHKGLQEYFDMTIRRSLLDKTCLEEVTMTPPPGHSSVLNEENARCLDSPIDFCAKLENLVMKVENDKEISEECELDEFLASINIQPLVLPYYESFEPDYLEKQITLTKEKCIKESQERKERQAEAAKLQQPEIPDYDFLMKNRLETMDEQIAKLMEKYCPEVAPVFPEPKGFTELIRNKVVTSSLDSSWRIDFLWAELNCLKFINLKCQPILINFLIYNPDRDIDESEVPIKFRLINVIDNADCRGNISINWNLRKREFRYATHDREDFTSECQNSSQIFEFLQSMDDIFTKVDFTVSKFFEIVERNGAIIQGDLNHKYKFDITDNDVVKTDLNPNPHIDVSKMIIHNKHEIHEIVIKVPQSIENISINDISLKSSSKTRRRLKFKQTISEMKGLQLLEVILYDTWAFIDKNSEIEKIYD